MTRPYYKDWPSNGYAIPKHHKQVTVYCPANDTLVTADEGIIADLQVLWHYGIGTRYSCQGPGYENSGRYIALEDGSNVDAVTELLPWAYASPKDRRGTSVHPNGGAVYARPGGSLCGIFLVSDVETMGDLH